MLQGLCVMWKRATSTTCLSKSKDSAGSIVTTSTLTAFCETCSCFLLQVKYTLSYHIVSYRVLYRKLDAGM